MMKKIKHYFNKPEAKALVLMYHRICKKETDPWQLAVSPENFESQIKEISKKYKVQPLSSLVSQFDKGEIEKNAVYITFDDAYSDNYTTAKPILDTYECPATIFVPTGLTGKNNYSGGMNWNIFFFIPKLYRQNSV